MSINTRTKFYRCPRGCWRLLELSCTKIAKKETHSPQHCKVGWWSCCCLLHKWSNVEVRIGWTMRVQWRLMCSCLPTGIWHVADGGSRAHCSIRASFNEIGRDFWDWHAPLLSKARISLRGSLHGQILKLLPDLAVYCHWIQMPLVQQPSGQLCLWQVTCTDSLLSGEGC